MNLPLESERYRATGHLPLPGLFAPEILSDFYNAMWPSLNREAGAMHAFINRAPILSRAALGVHSRQYPPMQAFLCGLTPRIALAAGCDLLPTYGFLRVYQKGDICRVHADRSACEHSLSLTIACAGDEPWALSVATEPTVGAKPGIGDDFGDAPFTSVGLRPGDAVLYRGITHRHGRLEPNPNRWSAHLFLHWVDADGPYCGEAFDRPKAKSVHPRP